LTRRVVVGVSGASGSVYGLAVLRILAEMPDIETHLVLSRSAAITIRQELDVPVEAFQELADEVHPASDIGASIASGSFGCSGMIIAPCSIKTLSAIANCYSDNLMSRAADVTLKEGRPLVLMVRETPLHAGHLRLMLDATNAGAVIAPPVPAFYTRPTSIDQLVDHSARRALARLGIETNAHEWTGLRPRPEPPAAK
jgi:4-hydroxy-3-polyprenylbenzoate decarboxylase